MCIRDSLNMYFPINYVCMCFIAYATGSELIVRRYRKLYKKILKVTLMVILSVFLCVSFPLFLLLDAVSARPAQGVPRSSYKYPDQTSVVFRVNVFDAEALHESEQKARDRMSRATHRMSRDSGAGMRDSRATGQD